MKLYFCIIVLSGILLSSVAHSYTQDIKASNCFEHYVKSGTNDEKFYYLKKCLDLFRQQQPLSPADNQYNYDPNRNSTVLLSHLLYFAKDQPPGTKLEILEELKDKASKVVNGSYCANKDGLGKVWCGRLSKLANMSTVKLDNDYYSAQPEFLRTVKPEDVIDYTICVKGASSLASRKKVCKRVCKNGHKYKFTCTILEELNTRGKVENAMKDRISACYGNQRANDCITLCEKSGDVMACEFAVVEARNQDVLDASFPITPSEENNHVSETESRLSGIGKAAAKAVNKSYSDEKNSSNITHSQMESSSPHAYSLNVSSSESSSKVLNSSQGKLNNGVSIPKGRVGTSVRSVNIKATSISSQARFNRPSSATALPYRSVLQPDQENSDVIGGKNKRGPGISNSPKPNSGGSSFSNQSPSSRAVSSKGKKRRRQMLPYKTYRDNLGSNSFHGSNPGSIQLDRNHSNKPKRKRLNKNTKNDSSHPIDPRRLQNDLEHGLNSINESYFSPEYLPSGQSLFDKQNKIYQNVKSEGALDQKGN